MAEKPSCLLLSAKSCHDPGIRDCSSVKRKPLQPKDVWSIRVRLEISRKWRDLALFNLAIDSKLRACDLVQLRLGLSTGHRFALKWPDHLPSCDEPDGCPWVFVKHTIGISRGDLTRDCLQQLSLWPGCETVEGLGVLGDFRCFTGL
jgi:hypothetical protein